MGIRDYVNRIFSRQQSSASVIASAPGTTIQEMPQPRSSIRLAGGLAATRQRRQTIIECRDMYKLDTRVKVAIKTVARDAVKGGFVVKVTNNPLAETIANDLTKRLNLRYALENWMRLTLKEGDSFLEIGVDADGVIALVTRKPTLQMHRASDRHDLFEDSRRAYWMSDEAAIGLGDEPPDNAIWFAQWQIIHIRWDHEEGQRYGEPLFAGATKAYRRMDDGEFNMAVRRKTRAGRRFLHVVEGANENELEAYRVKNQDALDDPFAAVSDFFSNKAGSISALDGDANLDQYEDVMHHVRTFFLASPVPMALLGYGQDLNRDVLQEQKEQYDEAIEQITEWVESQMVRPILELQWLLAGILPEGLDYEIVWKARNEPTPQDIRDAADAAIKLRALGLGEKIVLQIIAPFVPNVDLLADASLDAAASAHETTAKGVDQAVNSGVES